MSTPTHPKHRTIQFARRLITNIVDHDPGAASTVVLKLSDISNVCFVLFSQLASSENVTFEKIRESVR